jgi:hypothetical protein
MPMFGLFRRRDVAEGFIWSDGEFLGVAFSEEKKELSVDFIDYCERRSRFVFRGVEQIQISEPVYCVRSQHSFVDGVKKLRLFDDDGIVLSFCYRDVRQHVEDADPVARDNAAQRSS